MLLKHLQNGAFSEASVLPCGVYSAAIRSAKEDTTPYPNAKGGALAPTRPKIMKRAVKKVFTMTRKTPNKIERKTGTRCPVKGNYV